MISRRLVLAGAAAGVLASGCAPAPPGPLAPSGAPTPPLRLDPARHHVIARTPPGDAIAPDAVAAVAALVAVATAVVVVDPGDAALLARATARARALGVPVLPTGVDLAAELDRLRTRTVVSYVQALDAGGREVVDGAVAPDDAPLPGLPARAEAPGVLVLASDEPAPLVAATLASVGLTALVLPHPHRGPVVALGDGFGSDASFAAAVEATRTADELPGGGIVALPQRRLIALYGHPGTASLGMLGEQPAAQAVARLQRLVSEYQALLPTDQVVGAFEIITTVASASATPDGDYSHETPVAQLLPWVEAAEAAGMFVVLDLQPGRTDFLTQAKRYADLLRRPRVGLALDPEWRLRPGEKHLVRIGQVGVDEVNAVGTWLADLVRDHRLPPKILTLHQFQTRMVTERHRLDTSRPEIQWLVHVDGQGGQGAKQATWEVLRRDLPAGVFLGWKNFEHEDQPMLTPAQTVAQVHPTPHFVSYQ